MPSLNLLCHSKTDARFIQHGRKAVWSIPYISVAFFPSLKHNFIAYRLSKVLYCIFEIHQLNSNFCYSCLFEPEIIKIKLSSHMMYSNNMLNFQVSTTIVNAHMKKVWKLIVYTSYSEKKCMSMSKFLLLFELYESAIVSHRCSRNIDAQEPPLIHSQHTHIRANIYIYIYIYIYI